MLISYYICSVIVAIIVFLAIRNAGVDTIVSELNKEAKEVHVTANGFYLMCCVAILISPISLAVMVYSLIKHRK